MRNGTRPLQHVSGILATPPSSPHPGSPPHDVAQTPRREGHANGRGSRSTHGWAGLRPMTRGPIHRPQGRSVALTCQLAGVVTDGLSSRLLPWAGPVDDGEIRGQWFQLAGSRREPERGGFGGWGLWIDDGDGSEGRWEFALTLSATHLRLTRSQADSHCRGRGRSIDGAACQYHHATSREASWVACKPPPKERGHDCPPGLDGTQYPALRPTPRALPSREPQQTEICTRFPNHRPLGQDHLPLPGAHATHPLRPR